MSEVYTKDPDAVLDYVFDLAALTNGTGLSDWLASGETILSHVIDEDTGITVDSSGITHTNTAVTVWLSGGTAGLDYEVRCEWTTSAGRKDERTITIKVRER